MVMFHQEQWWWWRVEDSERGGSSGGGRAPTAAMRKLMSGSFQLYRHTLLVLRQSLDRKYLPRQFEPKINLTIHQTQKFFFMRNRFAFSLKRRSSTAVCASPARFLDDIQ